MLGFFHVSGQSRCHSWLQGVLMDGGNNHGSRFHTLDGMLKFGDITRYSVGSASPTVVTLVFLHPTSHVFMTGFLNHQLMAIQPTPPKLHPPEIRP